MDPANLCEQCPSMFLNGDVFQGSNPAYDTCVKECFDKWGVYTP